MLKRLFGWAKELLKEFGADVAGGGLAAIIFGKRDDKGNVEIAGLVQLLKEAFKGEHTVDAVRFFRKVKRDVRRRVEGIYSVMGGWDRARFEQVLGNVLAACRNEVDGVPALSRIIEEWDNEEPRRNGKARKKGKKVSETPVKGVVVSGRDAETNFIAFWNSFQSEDEGTIRLYLDMLDRAGILTRATSAVADRWQQFSETPVWARAKRLGLQYLVLLAALVGITGLFVLSTLFLGLEQYRWVAFAFFGVTAGLLTLLYALAFPLNRLLEEVAELLQEKEDEGSWQARKALIKRRVGQLAFVVLVLLLVPFVEHPEYLVALALAVIVLATLAGWKRTLAMGVVAVITVIALMPTITRVYGDYAVPTWEWVAERRETEPPPVAGQVAPTATVPTSTGAERLVTIRRGVFSPPVEVPTWHAIDWDIQETDVPLETQVNGSTVRTQVPLNDPAWEPLNVPRRLRTLEWKVPDDAAAETATVWYRIRRVDS